MNLQPIKELLKEQLLKQAGITVGSMELLPAGGGSINYTYKVIIRGHPAFFLKLNETLPFPGLFDKEKKGLEFLSQQHCILIPPVIFHQTAGSHQLLLLQWVESGMRNESFWKKFGEQLAALHQTSAAHFGFAEDNYMGSLPQANTFTENWTDFFTHYRLQPQLKLARSNHLLDKSHVSLFDALSLKLVSIFNPEKPALLHGDLWSGNFMCNEQSLPVLIDPAVYFGHRSMDLAMTTLFGGFDRLFYDAYHYHYPLPANYREQWEVCNLYPLLIHLNLFGKSYLPGILHTLKRFG